ncbi:ATP phosphoribosyltransferase [Nanchangia anserum]|uniref:ATP phosphoribosyltransferase n=1 Tax=Nanchangia anserum TaxID=2692125 RepID=A0A8I0GB67_9ACTO|nr:ATP phosphoribosyltransferase [Nanchangia anserum]MBD3688796.1 ATP phosphoribosyltransferase [Nanchangia anserum]QOX82529.1 ATP phosphoribosyltransferase [Nanchangia anserum]
MLRLAIPNKGALSEAAVSMLAAAGYRTKRRGRELSITDERADVTLFFLRPRDIAVAVSAGTIDAGITGRDLLIDANVEAREIRPLGFGASTFRFAAPQGSMSSIHDLAGKRIATSFDWLVRRYLAEHGVEASIVHLDGAVESSIQLGVADAIADVVETGTTLKAAGLEVFGEPILRSEAVLITTPARADDPRLAVLDRRLHGVMVARDYVLMDYNVSLDSLETAAQVTPGFESPTISHLRDTDWVAVRALVERREVNDVMDRLYAVGARAILVTEVMSCRL